VATFSTSMPRIVSLAPETSDRPRCCGPGGSVDRQVPTVTVDASIDTLAAVSVGSGVAEPASALPGGKVERDGTPSATSTASMAARSVHSGTEAELTTTVDPVHRRVEWSP